jgi:hypothetical protein
MSKVQPFPKECHQIHWAFAPVDINKSTQSSSSKSSTQTKSDTWKPREYGSGGCGQGGGPKRTGPGQGHH